MNQFTPFGVCASCLDQWINVFQWHCTFVAMHIFICLCIHMKTIDTHYLQFPMSIGFMILLFVLITAFIINDIMYVSCFFIANDHNCPHFL